MHAKKTYAEYALTYVHTSKKLGPQLFGRNFNRRVQLVAIPSPLSFLETGVLG